MEASSRDEVFATLRQRGIKPIKVVAADGSKANGEIRGVRKRVVAGIAVIAAVGVGVVAFLAGERGAAGVRALPSHSAAPRHQIYGDPVIMDEFERGRFEEVLTNRFDQMLAWFAQPGKLMCPKGTDPRRMLAWFAQPGKLMCPKGTDPRRMGEEFAGHNAAAKGLAVYRLTLRKIPRARVASSSRS